MRVLIACEESQTECMAFREYGFEAYAMAHQWGKFIKEY